MPPAKHVIFKEFDRGDVYEDLAVERIHFENCVTESGPADELRPTVRGSTFRKIKVTRCNVTGVVLEDVVFDGVRLDRDSGFFFAVEFRRVVFKGRIGNLALLRGHADPRYAEGYIEKLQQAEDEAEWSLDISEAIGEIETRDYNVDKIRIDPARQAIVRRTALAHADWRTQEYLRGTSTAVVLDMLERFGWPATILSANPAGRDFREDMDIIAQLRAEGIAE